MKVLKILMAALGVLLAAVVVLGFIGPKEFKVERSTFIDAPKEKVFPHVQYFEKRNAWYPWSKLDPNMKSEIVGEDGTVGAMSKWEGNEKVGKGEQIITEIAENQHVMTRLVFHAPEQSEADAYVKLEDKDNGTEVKWGLDAAIPFLFRGFLLFQDMEASRIEVENDYDSGLAMLKEIVEKEAAVQTFRGLEVKPVNFPAKQYVGVREKIAIADMEGFFGKNMMAVATTCQEKQIATVGKLSGLYYVWDEENQMTDLAVVQGTKEVLEVEGMSTFELPAGEGLMIDYYGNYEGSKEAHFAMDDYLKANKLEVVNGIPVIEEYVIGPETEQDPAKWLTKVYYYVQPAQVAAK